MTVMGDAAALPLIAPGLQVAVYCVIALPPLLVGGVNAIVAIALPDVATPIAGAPGAVAVMLTLRVTCVAAAKLASPDWFAAMVQVPAASIVTITPLTEQMPDVIDVCVTASPEDAVPSGLMANMPLGAKARVTTLCALNVIVCVLAPTLNDCMTDGAALLLVSPL